VYQRAFIQEMNLWQRIEAMRPLVFSTKLAQLAANLLGVAGVRLYHDQALVKQGFGGRTPWHCDQYYWPLDTDDTVTIWIPLQDTPLAMGPLAFSVGSHHVDLGRHLDISADSERQITSHRRWQSLPIDVAPAMLGDVTAHRGWTFHGAEPNTTADDRLVFTIIYFADGTRLKEPTTKGQRVDRDTWLPGTKVGEPIESLLSPLMWHQDGRHRETWAQLPPRADYIGTVAITQ
jgi:ectoine hydroxylase-related dioxygenase (phytanoyl-CoA dioxygenase family)